MGADGTAARRWRVVRSCNVLVSIGDGILRRRAERDPTLAFIGLSAHVTTGETISVRSLSDEQDSFAPTTKLKLCQFAVKLLCIFSI